MIEIYKDSVKCNITFLDEISVDDIAIIENVFEEKYDLFFVKFVNIYSVPKVLVNLIHSKLQSGTSINISSDRNRLSRYFNKLGFKIKFNTSFENIQNINSNHKIIAIGGSANSTKKIIEILSSIDTTKFSIFIIQHIDPSGEFLLSKILAKYIKNTKINNIIGGEDVKSSNIYIAPNNKHVLVHNNKIFLNTSEKRNYARPSISKTFESLSYEYKNDFLAILECGYGKDGVDSIKNIKKNFSTLIVQEPFECEKADSIVSKAIENGSYDFKFLTKEIISYLNIISINKSKDEWIEYLLDEVHNIHGYDFKLYGLNYVERRIEAFMKKNIIKTYKVFVLKVLYDKVCFKSFFLDLSINITCFFRSIESSKRMLNLLKYHKNSYNIKIWSAGCSSGKEAYSTAVLLDELNLLDKSVIYATDFNDIIIQEAKNGLYSIDSFVKAKEEHKKLGLIKPIEDYFILHGDYVEISKKLSEKVMFFVHNLENDGAFNEFSVIECKNVLIYFNEELQSKVIKLFYDSLKFGGHLFLGPSERLPSSFMNKFKVCSDKYKVYRKVS